MTQAAEWDKSKGSSIRGATESDSTPAAASALSDENCGAINGSGRQEGEEVAGATEGGDDGDGNGDEAGVGGKRWHPEIELSSKTMLRRVAERLKGHTVPGETVESLRAVLKQFCGTKNYHNFTNNKKGSDSSCNR